MIIQIIIAIIIAGAAFFGGMQYQKSQAAANGNGTQEQNAQGHGGQNGQDRFGNRGGGATFGQILATDSASVTVKLQDGSSKIVNISDSTRFSKTDTASKSDLKTGQRIAAFGTTNSDGSINAQTIQLNPQMERFGARQGENGQQPNGAQ